MSVNTESDTARARAIAAAFPVPFSAEDYDHVAAPLLAGDALVALEILAASGAVQPVDDASSRFQSKEVAASPLPPDGDIAAAIDAWLITRGEALAALTYGATASRALDDLAQLQPHLLGLVDRMHNTRDIAASTAATRAWLALFDVVLFRSTLDLRDARFRSMIAVADAAGNAHRAGRVRVFAARAALDVGPPEDVDTLLTGALRIAENAADAAVMAEAQRSRAWRYIALGDPTRAKEAVGVALEGAAALGDVRGQADAFAALGVATFFGGDPREAKRHLGFARALHAGQGETVRLARVNDMLLLVGAATDARDVAADVACVVSAAHDHAARGQAWRAALDFALAAALERAAGHDADAAALDEHAHEQASQSGTALGAAWKKPAAIDAAPAWSFGPECRWFIAPDGTRHDLSRHASLRRVLDALVSARLERPGTALNPEALVREGWPDEKIIHSAALLRVYTAVRRVRQLGLGPLLCTRDDGYLLDAAVPVARVSV